MSAAAQRAPLALAFRRIDLVVCTFHRETLLAQTLASLAAQSCPNGWSLRVLVVDNSDEGTARETVARAAGHSPFEIVYAQARPANIALARNAGVALARAEFVGFLDDDNQVRPGWLAAMAQALDAMPHDVVFGALEAAFEAPERATAATRRLFTREPDLPPGADLFAFGLRQTRGVALSTNNVVLRRAMLPDAPFDLALGHGGGEDYDLFCRLQKAGARMGWRPQARACEFVPAARCAPAYLRRRFYVGGQTFAAGAARASRFPLARRWWLRVRALVQLVGLAALWPAQAWRGPQARLDASLRLAGTCGKLSFGAVYPLYRREARP